MSVFMNIKYDEFEGQDTYRGVKVGALRSDQARESERVFTSGDPVDDWNEAITYAREVHKDHPESWGILCSSDVDNFLSEEPQAFYIDEDGFMHRSEEEGN